MVTPSYNTFEINGISFRQIGNETVAGRIFYTKQECIDYAYGRNIVTVYNEPNAFDEKVLPKKNRAIPPKKRDLKF